MKLGLLSLLATSALASSLLLFMELPGAQAQAACAQVTIETPLVAPKVLQPEAQRVRPLELAPPPCPVSCLSGTQLQPVPAETLDELRALLRNGRELSEAEALRLDRLLDLELRNEAWRRQQLAGSVS